MTPTAEELDARVRDLLADGPYSDADIVAVSGLSRAGIDDLRAAIDRTAAALPGRAAVPGPARLLC